MNSRYRSKAPRILLLLGALVSCVAASSSQLEHFVTRRGDKMMDGDKELRFVSYNIPNLHYIEDNHQFEQPNPWRVADAFEIQDGLAAIKQSGGRVVRIYTLSIRKAIDDSNIVRHLTGPGKFNEEAFRAYDRVLETANRMGVRVIIPIFDNWQWWGGPKEYAAMRGLDGKDFWTDSLLLADAKGVINFLVNRINTCTGVKYCNDKAILGWETGNELQAPYAWTKQIAAYIKSLDSNHLVIEGTHALVVSDEALADPNVDVLTNHYYGPAADAIPRILVSRGKTRGIKPYFIGEFGFCPLSDMRAMIDTVISSGVSGIMVWSLRTHNRDGGFYYHTNAYRWPGFPSGSPWDEQAVTHLFREKAFEINGEVPDTLPVPAPPALLPIITPFKVSWQGSAGAESYLIERSSDDGRTWTVLAPGVSDALIGYRPLFSDTSAVEGSTYRYRVSARNGTGCSAPSAPSGPVDTGSLMIIDEMDGQCRAATASAGVHPVPPYDVAQAKEDPSRVTGGADDYVEYAIPGTITNVRVDLFDVERNASVGLTLRSADSTGVFLPIAADRTVYEPFKNEYREYAAVSITRGVLPPTHHRLRIPLAPGLQLSRVEIEYESAGK